MERETTGYNSVVRALADGRYQILEPIGEGGAARVFRVRDTFLGVERAVKVVTHTTRQHRLHTEARLMAQMEHPNILRVFDVGQDGDHGYIVMELCTGGSLQDRVDRTGPLEPVAAVLAILNILSALTVAHAAGVVHRDIKPQNLLIGADGAVLLADFGIGHAPDAARATRTGVAMGTFGYMAPEQRLDAHTAGAGADIYAVGATLYALLTAGNPVDLFMVGERSPRWSGIPAILVPIIIRATRHDVGQRYAVAAEMSAALEAALREGIGRPVWPP